MKKIYSFRLLTFVILCQLVFTTCKKENENSQITQRFGTGLREGIPENYAVLPKAKFPPTGTLPSSFTIANIPPAGNQGNQGACTGFATGWGLMSHLRAKANNLSYHNGNNINLNAICSPSYIYNQIKKGSDCLIGSWITDALDLLKDQGVCTIGEMPFNENDCTTQPTQLQRQSALANKILYYETLPINIEQIKAAIYNGNPVIIAIHLNNGFYNPESINGRRIWKTIQNGGETYHAMVVYGYDDNLNAFKALNSWGDSWMENGSIWIDYTIFSITVDQAYIAHGVNGNSNNKHLQLSGNLDFGNIAVGMSSTRILTINNPSTTPITINSIGSPYPFIANFSGIIQPGNYVTVNVSFIPQSPQTYTGYLKIYSTSSIGIDSLLVTGTGTSQSASLNIVGDLNFGNVTIGQSSIKVIKLTNAGVTPITVTNITTTTGYSTNWSGGYVPAGSSQDVVITFSPSTIGSANGTVTILSNASNNNIMLHATGVGMAATPIHNWIGCNEPYPTVYMNGVINNTNYFKFRVSAFNPINENITFEWGVCNNSWSFPYGTGTWFFLDDNGNLITGGPINMSDISKTLGGYFNFMGKNHKTFYCFMTTNINGNSTYYYAGKITLYR